MLGISSSGKEKIQELVEKLFDKVTLKLLGYIPSLREKKNIVFNVGTNLTLANLFVQSVGNKPLTPAETDALRGLLSSSNAYIEAIKHNTKANVVEQIDGLVKQAKISGIGVNSEQIKSVLDEQMDKARNAIKVIAESETTKVRNVGSVVDIVKVAAEKGIEDPNVFFTVVRDGHACKWCIKNHLHEDGTPKVFKLSEVKQSYLSSADKQNGEVSISGQHPCCRCPISYLAPGFGFKKGRLSYISQNHDEHAHQKKNR